MIHLVALVERSRALSHEVRDADAQRWESLAQACAALDAASAAAEAGSRDVEALRAAMRDALRDGVGRKSDSYVVILVSFVAKLSQRGQDESALCAYVCTFLKRKYLPSLDDAPLASSPPYMLEQYHGST